MRNRSLRRQKAINILLKRPDAPAAEVARRSGLSVQTVRKIIKQRQTPVEVLKANWKRVVEPDEAQWKTMAVEAIKRAKSNKLSAAKEAEVMADIAAGPPPGVQMLLDAAHVFDERGKTYGDAAAHWRDVALVWSSVSGAHINADTAVKMMIAVKLLRLKASPNHMDSITDIAGYAAVLANVVSE
jgi:hypothetical protein